jgi:Zn-dependent protease
VTTLAQALTLDQLRQAIGGPSLDDTIKGVASMASISLALLTLFTTRRTEAVARAEENLAAFSREELRGGLVVDALLTLVTGIALAAMAPLLVSALDGLQFGHQAGALRTIFVVVWVAFLGLVVYQVRLVVRSASRVKKKG